MSLGFPEEMRSELAVVSSASTRRWAESHLVKVGRKKHQKVQYQGEQWGGRKKGMCPGSAERKKVESRTSMRQSGHSPPLPSVPRSSPSCPIRYNARPVFPPLAAAPPPWQSVNKSPALGHAPSAARAVFSVFPPTLGGPPLFAKPRPSRKPPGIPAPLAPPPPGMALGRPRPRLPCPARSRTSPGGAAHPARRWRESVPHTPSAPRAGDSQPTPPRLRACGAAPSRLREGPGVPDGRGRVSETECVSRGAPWRRSRGRRRGPATGRPLGWKRRLQLPRRLRPPPRVRSPGPRSDPSPRGGSSGRCSSPRSTSSPFACSAATKLWKSSRSGSSPRGPGSSTPTATSGTGGPAGGRGTQIPFPRRRSGGWTRPTLHGHFIASPGTPGWGERVTCTSLAWHSQ